MAETRNAMFFLLRRRSLSPPACGCAEAPWEGYIMDSMGVFGSAEGEGLLYWHHLGCPEQSLSIELCPFLRRWE
ncbi:hypothetical protein Ahy_B03g066762 isoform G [Arachis hypogaea]|uniref:Uncharacterized protein n=1 Tax=Arachis hypogaea TaxID=3818 RepID=A0A445A4W6_ARAHY|nr:hypothetical protein Ahy_B03g066762 isoform G [Arachis hypogaea]